MQIHIRGYAERAATPAEPGTPIRFVASTEKVGRDGLVIAADGWQLDNFRANPTFLWHHDYMGSRAPIGKVTNVAVEKNRLVADVVFDQGDPFAVDVERKYRDGFMNAVSVGWDTQQIEPSKGDGASKVTQAELLDISAVNIPGDPNALMERQKRALRDLLSDLDTIEPDDTTPASMTWDDAADQMVRLHLPGLQRPDAERKAAYQTLARTYASHGKHAPEYVPTDTLDAFDLADVRGLFLEGEADRFPQLFGRAGAVLSTRNKSDLETAMGLIAGVIERASKEPAPSETPEEPSEPRAVNPTLAQLHALIVKKAS